MKGFAVASREEVDAVADQAKKSSLLKFGPAFLNPYAGYLCIISNPDGHMGVFLRPGFGKARAIATIRRTSGLHIGVKAGFVYAATCLLFLRNSSRSALIVSASVVGMP